MANTNNLDLQRPGLGDQPGEWGTVALNGNFTTLDGLFGAADGHGHTGQVGDGPAINHDTLLGRGTRSHLQLEADIAALQDQINDIDLVDVEEVDASGAPVSNSRVIDVSKIQFVNCDVDTTGVSGEVKVTPRIPSSAAYEVTAPVNHFDAFVGQGGMDLNLQAWDRFSLAQNGGFKVQATGNGLEADPVYGAWTTNGSGPSSSRRTAGLGYTLGGAVPHSEVQRMCVVVERAEFEGEVGIGPPDELKLDVGILVGWDQSQNTSIVGLWLQVQRIGDLVDARFRVATGSNVVEHTIQGPGNQTGPWTNKPSDYIQGQHEISLSKDSVSGLYWLHYYYNKSLIYKYPEPINGDPFFNQVRALIAQLESTIAYPDFGQFAIALRIADVVPGDTSSAVGRPLKFYIDSTMASSVGERINPKFISSGFGGEGGTPPPPGDEVCPNTDPNPYEGLFLGDTFTPAGGNTQLTVVALGFNSFTAEDSQGQLFVFYCSGAGGGNPGSGSGSGDPGGEAGVDGNNNDMQVGPGGTYASTTFVADTDIPIDWETGNLIPANVIAAGDPLPAGFITGQATMAEEGASGGPGEGEGAPLGGVPKFTFATGTRLPLGTKISAVVDPAYDAQLPGNSNLLTSTFPDLINIEALPPTNLSTKAWVYRENTWLPLGPENKLRRGDGLAYTVTGKNLPLDGFWAPGVGFGRDYRIESNDLCELSLGASMFEDGAEYFSSFELGGPAQNITGPMPSSVLTPGAASNPRPAGAPTIGVGGATDVETLVVVGRFNRIPSEPGASVKFFSDSGVETTRNLWDQSTFEPMPPVMTVLNTVPEGATSTVVVRVTVPSPYVADLPASHTVFTLFGTPTPTTVIDSVTYAPVVDPGPGSTWYVDATLTVTTTTPETVGISYNDTFVGCAGELVVTETGVTAPDPPQPTATIAESDLYQCASRTLSLSIPAGNVTEGDVVTISAAAGTCTLTSVEHTFTSAEASSGYSLSIPAIGIVGQTPEIEVSYNRVTATNPTSPTQTLTLGLLTPPPLSISGTADYDFAEVVDGVLVVEVGILTAPPWSPGYLESTVSDSSASGDAELAATSPVQSLGGGQYRFRITLGNSIDWATGDTVTLSVPNHDTCAADAGSTQWVITLTVNSGITTVRSGQIYNRFPYNIIVEGATAADEGDTVEVINSAGDLLQDLGTLAAADIRIGTRAGVDSEAVLEGIFDIDLAAYGSIEGQIPLFLRVGSSLVLPIQRSVSGGFTELINGYLSPPPSLEAALDFVGGEYSSPLGGVSENSVVTVNVRNENFAFIQPNAHVVTGNLSGTPYNPEVSFIATWTFTGGVINSVVELPTANSRLRTFTLDLGALTGTSGSLALTLTQVDPTDAAIATLSTRTYSALITINPDSGGAGPVVGQVLAGS